MNKIKSFIKSNMEMLTNYRHSFHSIPEPSYKEFATSEFIKKELDKLNISYKTVGKTAIVAEIGVGETVVGFRFNMDGLEGCVEKTNLSFSAKTHAHACGHDVELACAMLLVKYFIENEPKGKVVFVFQPAEEGPGDDELGRDGGKFLADNGVFDGLDALLSLHVDPDLPIGTVCAHNGLATLDALDFEFHIQGISAHSSRPHEFVRVIPVKARIELAVEELRGRIIDSATQFEWANPYLVIETTQDAAGLNVEHPFEAEVNTQAVKGLVKGTTRIFDENGLLTCESVKKNLEGIRFIAENELQVEKAKLNLIGEVGCKLYTNICAVATRNDERVTEEVAKAIIASGFKHVSEVKKWKDAAGHTAQKAPVCHGYVGCGKDSGKLHQGDFYPDEGVTAIMLEMFIKSAENLFDQKKAKLTTNDLNFD